MILPQFVVIGLMIAAHHPIAALVVTGLAAAQILLMVDLLDEPRERAIWYNATGTSLYVTGMLACAIALGSA
jgi:chlorophyll synthase